MKKIKIFAAAIAFCGASLLGYNAYSNATMTDQERMMLKNIEALMQTESTGTCTAVLACSILDADYNYVSCSGKTECIRNASERWVSCDGVKSSC